jgi:hypothetical protein
LEKKGEVKVLRMMIVKRSFTGEHSILVASGSGISGNPFAV